MKMPSTVQVPNQSGTFKKFRSLNANGVRDWQLSCDAPKVVKQKKLTKKELDAMILDRGDEAIGSSFPDGDPIDHLYRFMSKHNICMEDFDRVFNKHYKIKTGFYGYLANIWDDQQRDAISDARSGSTQLDSYSNYYYLKAGELVLRQNPWLPS